MLYPTFYAFFFYKNGVNPFLIFWSELSYNILNIFLRLIFRFYHSIVSKSSKSNVKKEDFLMCMRKNKKNEYNVLNSYLKYKNKKKERWLQFSYDIRNFLAIFIMDVFKKHPQKFIYFLDWLGWSWRVLNSFHYFPVDLRIFCITVTLLRSLSPHPPTSLDFQLQTPKEIFRISFPLNALTIYSLPWL